MNAFIRLTPEERYFACIQVEGSMHLQVVSSGFSQALRFLATLSLSRQFLAIAFPELTSSRASSQVHAKKTLQKHPIRIFWRSSLWN